MAPNPASGSISKRVLDITFATLGIIATAPAWLLIPLAIKLDDGGPVFYGQPRVGRGGRVFTSWKFRSMRPLENASGPPLQAHLEEERVTRVGRLLRPTALDELPQLLTILRGEMSLVGPRALAPEEAVASATGSAPVPSPAQVVRLAEVPGYEERHSVRPGLTGLAQVHAPREASHRTKFRYDLLYVRKKTLCLDVQLILRSVWTSLTGAWPEVGKGRPSRR